MADDSVLQTALKRFRLAEDAESENRKAELEDLKFRAGQQWDDQMIALRKQERRPCLTIRQPRPRPWMLIKSTVSLWRLSSESEL